MNINVGVLLKLGFVVARISAFFAQQSKPLNFTLHWDMAVQDLSALNSAVKCHLEYVS